MGIFFDSKQERLDNKLFKALSARDMDKTREALDAGAAIEAKGHWSWAFHAVNNKFPEALPLLIERGCPVDMPGPYGYTPLRMACAGGQVAAAKLLLEKGAQIDHPDENGFTPLHGAAQAGKMDMIVFLIDAGADMNARDRHMNTAADVANKQYPRIAEYLWEKMGVETSAVAPASEDGWHVTGENEIAHVSSKPAIGYRMTEVFNFSAKIYTHIAENTRTHAESNSVKTFDELAGSLILEQAFEAFRARGGKADAHGIDKPKPGGGSLHRGPQS